MREYKFEIRAKSSSPSTFFPFSWHERDKVELFYKLPSTLLSLESNFRRLYDNLWISYVTNDEEEERKLLPNNL